MTARTLDPIFTSAELTERVGLLPNHLQVFINGAAALAMERADIERTLEELGDRIPKTQRDVGHRRLPDLEKQMDQRLRLAGAISRYEPYTIPADFMVGFADAPSDVRMKQLGMTSALVFNAPIPGKHMVQYIDAGESGIFDEIVIASSDASLFRVVHVTPPPRPIRVDPFMVGLVYLPDRFECDFRIGTRGNEIRGASGFLIAHWDLSREIAK